MEQDAQFRGNFTELCLTCLHCNHPRNPALFLVPPCRTLQWERVWDHIRSVCPGIDLGGSKGYLTSNDHSKTSKKQGSSENDGRSDVNDRFGF